MSTITVDAASCGERILLAWNGAIIVVLLAGMLAAGRDAQAQAEPALSPQTLLAQANRTVSFDIPGQPLASALTAFGRQSGLQIVVDPASVAGKTSPPVIGTMSAEQALQRLLGGSGLSYRFTSANTVAVTASIGSGAFQLDPVRVPGSHMPPQAMIDNVPPAYAGGQVATGGQVGLLGNRGVMDTPFNQTNFTAKKAQDQQAVTVRDVLADDPSVRQVRVDGGAIDDSIFIRGFLVSPAAYTYGGLNGMLPALSPMVELAERIEVLKGPSVMLNGMPPFGSIGGTVNVVPKRAPDEDLTQLTAQYISAGQFGGHADLARRFGADKQFGVRFNGVFRAGQTEVENNSDQRGLTVLGLDFRGDRVRLAADLGYQYQYIGGLVGYLGLANGVPLPWAPSARKNQGQPWNFQERKDVFGVARAEFDVTEHITAYAAFGAHDFRLQGLYTFGNTITNVNGTATAFAPFGISQYNSYLTGQAGLRALADTGPIGHEFAVNATTVQLDSGTVTAPGTTFATNIYNPTVIARPNLAIPTWTRTGTQSLDSLGVADTLSAADRRIQLTAGARLQRIVISNFSATTGALTSGSDQSAFSPSVALVVKPWQNVSLYANWIQGLQPGTIVGSTFRNAGEVLPPFKSTQYEAGVKVDWGRFTTTASLFEITQPSVLTDVATNTQSLAGEQRNQGLELNVFGELTTGIRLLGGVTFLNPVLAKTQGGLTDGWIAPFTPQLQVNLGGEWDVPFLRGLTLNGRVIYTGSQYIDTTWPRRSLPEWTRFDLGLRYAFDNPGAPGRPLVARFNVDNVLDNNYWAGGVAANALFLGAPRTFRVSLTADF